MQFSKYEIKSLFGTVALFSCFGLGLLDLFNMLPPSLDVLDKVIAYILLFFLWYEINMSEILFGFKSKKLDVALILIFYVLSSQVLVQILAPDAAKFAINRAALQFVKKYIYIPGVLAFTYALLHFVPLFFFKSVSTQEDSVFTSIAYYLRIRKRLRLHKKRYFLTRYILCYGILITFYTVVFEKIMQWTVATIDKSLLVIGFFYAFHYSEHISASSFAQQIDDLEKDMTQYGLRFFTHPKQFANGLAGLLILFTLSEIGFFVIPYFTGGFDAFYEIQHDSIFKIINNDMTQYTLDINDTLILYSSYFMSFFGFMILMIFPMLLYLLAMTDWDNINIFNRPYLLCIVITFFLSFFVIGNMNFTLISKKGVYGVNLYVLSLMKTQLISELALKIVFIQLFFIGLVLCTKYFDFHNVLSILATRISFLFLGKYLYFFSISQLSGYYQVAKGSLTLAYSYKGIGIKYLWEHAFSGPKVVASIQHVLKFTLISKLWAEITLITLFYLVSYVAYIYVFYDWLTRHIHVSKQFIIQNITSFIILLTVLLLFNYNLYLLILFFLFGVFSFINWKKSTKDVKMSNYYFILFFACFFVFTLAPRAYVSMAPSLGLPIENITAIIFADILSIVFLFSFLTSEFARREKFTLFWGATAVIVGIYLGMIGIFAQEELPISPTHNWFKIIGFLLAVALFEEVLFRDVLYRAFNFLISHDSSIYTKTGLVIVQAYLFAIVHLVGGTIKIGTMLHLFLFAVFMIALREKTQSLQYPVIAHIVTNAVIMISQFYPGALIQLIL